MTHNPLCGTDVPEKAMTDPEMLNQTLNRHSRAGYAMTHDPLCPYKDDDNCGPDHTFPSCSCPACQCHLIAKVRQDALAKCIAVVEAVHSPIRIDDDLSYCRGCADAAYEEYSFAWPCAVVTAVHALQEKP